MASHWKAGATANALAAGIHTYHPSALQGHVDVTQAALYLQAAGGLVNFWLP